MIHEKIKTELESLGVPVKFQLYEGDLETYITYIQYDEKASLIANDQEIGTNFYYQINVFSKSDYQDLVVQVKEKMRNIGGIRTSEADIRANEGTYQRSMRFKFTL